MSPTEFSREITPNEKITCLEDFSRAFLELVETRATGTFRVTYGDGAEIRIFFRDGGVGDVDPDEQHTLLFQALISTGRVTDKDLKKARKRSEKEGLPLGLCLFDLNRVGEEELLGYVEELVTDRVCEGFSESVQSYEFFHHDKYERLNDFNASLSEIFDLFFDGEELFIEAMRRRERWDLVQELMPSLWDIYYATPRGMRYYNEPELYPVEVAILSQVDGKRDLEEIIAAASQLSPFECLQHLKVLARQHDIEIVNPVQLFQIGVDCAERRKNAKAWKVFRRAIQRGLDDFDVQFKFAETCAAIERNDEAIEIYRSFAEKCLDQARRKEAILAYRRIAKIDPLDLETRGKLVDLLISIERLDEAMVQAWDTAERLIGAGRPREALDQLLALKDKGIKEGRLSHKIIRLAEECGENEILEQELSSDPSRIDEILEPEKALETYERLFCEGNDSIDVRIKLITFHHDIGNRDKALKHINGVLGTSKESEIRDVDLLARLHKIRCELCPGDIPSHHWLVDYQLKKGRVQEAIATLRDLIEQLQHTDNHFLLVDARKRLVLLDKDNYEPRWELARLFRRLGHQEKAIAEIEQVAKIAMRREDRKTAREAWSKILEVAPYHTDALFGVGECLECSGDLQGAIARYEAVGTMDIVAGNIDRALRCYDRLEQLGDADVSFQLRLAKLLLESSRKEKALGILKSLSRNLVDTRDLGNARVALDLAFCQAPGEEDVLALKAELENLEEKLEAPDTPAPSTSPVSDKPATDDHGPTALKSEPFQGRNPITTRSKVSAISARLKNLQGDEDGGSGSTRPGGTRKVPGGVQNITSALQGIRGEAISEPLSEDEAQLVTQEDSRVANAEIISHRPPAGREARSTENMRTTTTRLKSLAKGDNEASGDSGVQVQQSDALAKLRALKKRGEANDSDEQGSSQSAEASAPAETSSSPKNDALARAVESSRTGVQVQMKSQGAALARLRALKESGEASDSDEQDSSQPAEASAPAETSSSPKNDALARAVESSRTGVQVQMKDQGAALARLRALKQGGQPSPTQQGTTEPAQEITTEASDATESVLEREASAAGNDSLAGAVESAKTGVQVRMKNQGSALAKLRALKQDAPGPESAESSD